MATTKGRLLFDHTAAISKAQVARVSASVRSTLLAVLGEGQRRAPVDIGTLRGDIHLEPEPKPGDLQGTVVSSVEYAIFQEYGTSVMAAHPYMTPAAESQRAPFARRVARALKGAA